jgi:predicted kinase
MSESNAESALSMIIQDSEQLQQDGPGPARALIMSGPPLSGKSHIVNIMEKRAPGSFLLVRSDYVRPMVAKSLGHKRPVYDDIEHATTFIVASEVVRAGLTMNWPVICDATNLREEFRRWAYEPAEDLKAEVLIVFMQVTDEIANSRLAERRRSGSAATFSVYKKLKYEMESISKCSRPYIVINSDGDMRPYAKILSRWLTGKTDNIPGLNRPHAKKVYNSEDTPKEPAEIYVSRPYWKDQNEEVPAEPISQPAPVSQVPKKQKPKGAKRIIYDFYTGEEIEIDD